MEDNEDDYLKMEQIARMLNLPPLPIKPINRPSFDTLFMADNNLKWPED